MNKKNVHPGNGILVYIIVKRNKNITEISLQKIPGELKINYIV